MGNLKVKEPKKPQYKGTTVCRRCDAEYSVGTQWVEGWWDEDSSWESDIEWEKRIPLGTCPVCGFKQKK